MFFSSVLLLVVSQRGLGWRELFGSWTVVGNPDNRLLEAGGLIDLAAGGAIGAVVKSAELVMYSSGISDGYIDFLQAPLTLKSPRFVRAANWCNRDRET